MIAISIRCWSCNCRTASSCIFGTSRRNPWSTVRFRLAFIVSPAPPAAAAVAPERWRPETDFFAQDVSEKTFRHILRRDPHAAKMLPTRLSQFLARFAIHEPVAIVAEELKLLPAIVRVKDNCFR